MIKPRIEWCGFVEHSSDEAILYVYFIYLYRRSGTEGDDTLTAVKESCELDLRCSIEHIEAELLKKYSDFRDNKAMIIASHPNIANVKSGGMYGYKQFNLKQAVASLKELKTKYDRHNSQ